MREKSFAACARKVSSARFSPNRRKFPGHFKGSACYAASLGLINQVDLVVDEGESGRRSCSAAMRWEALATKLLSEN
jgi:hypothetical protein